MVKASQQVEEELAKAETEVVPAAKSRWGQPTTESELLEIRRNGIPKTTRKQTEWAVSILASEGYVQKRKLG